MTAGNGILPLHGTVQDHAWGAPGILAHLLGRTASGGPEAEYWLGAHPASPSLAKVAGSMVPLDELIAADPEEMLGTRRAGDSLPFLLKVLAIGRPLSLQVHPSIAQAQAGFERENNAGIPIAASHRSYRDRNQKPEILLALEPTTAISGVRPPDEACAALAATARAAVTASAAPAAVPSALIDLVCGDPELEPPAPIRWADLLAAALRCVFTLSAEAGAKLQSVLRDSYAAEEPSGALLRLLADAFPDDPTVVVALLLNQITLQPGDALFNAAGTLHSYVSGSGVELMANSDNVLRGGLTPKYIDADELLAVTDLRPSPPHTVAPQSNADGFESVYRTPAQEFQLSLVDLSQVPGSGADVESREGPETLLLLGNQAKLRLRWAGGELELWRGGAAFVPAAVDTYQVAGTGKLYRARLPD